MITIQDKKAEVEFFDDMVQVNNYDVFTTQAWLNILAKLKLFCPSRDSVVLEVGCGTGAFSAHLSTYYNKLNAIDISTKSIKFAKARYPRVKFKVMDAEKMSYSSSKFDLVILSGILHHFPNRKKLLWEVYRVLKPGGKVFAYDPNGSNPFMWLYRNKKSPLYSSKGITSNEVLLTKRQLIPDLVEQGFDTKIVGMSGVYYKYVMDRPSIFLWIFNSSEFVISKITLLSRSFGSFLITYATK